MKTTLPQVGYCVGPGQPRRLTTGKGLILAAALLSLMALAGGLKAQSDNFDDGNDAGWTHYDPVGDALGSPRGTWSFTNGAYRIQSIGAPPGALGQARVASVRNDVAYTNFYVAVDVVAWNDTLRQSFGLLSRLGNIALGHTVGYAFTYQAISHNIQINRITNELPAAISPAVTVALDTNKMYRMVFDGIGPSLRGRVYELPDVITPIISVTATNDSIFSSGVAGLLVYDNSSTRTNAADTTFDNYLAAEEEPPRLSIQTDQFNVPFVSWPASATSFHLQGTLMLSAPDWITITNDIFTDNGTNQYGDLAPSAARFFRLAK